MWYNKIHQLFIPHGLKKPGTSRLTATWLFFCCCFLLFFVLLLVTTRQSVDVRLMQQAVSFLRCLHERKHNHLTHSWKKKFSRRTKPSARLTHEANNNHFWLFKQTVFWGLRKGWGAKNPDIARFHTTTNFSKDGNKQLIFTRNKN